MLVFFSCNMKMYNNNMKSYQLAVIMKEENIPSLKFANAKLGM